MAALLLASTWLAYRAAAQPPPAPSPAPLLTPSPAACTTVSGFPLPLPVVPTAKPKPLTGAGSVEELLGKDPLSRSDAAFEVIVGQARILTLKDPLAVDPAKPQTLITTGNPLLIRVDPVGPQHLRIWGLRPGVTDLSILIPGPGAADRRIYTFEVHVVYDLNLLRCRLKALFPDTTLKLAQLNNKIVVEGEARDTVQVGQIIQTLNRLLISENAVPTGPPGAPPPPSPAKSDDKKPNDKPADQAGQPAPTTGQPPAGGDSGIEIINLLRVPGPQQVLLKVRIAELNRTAMREIGADLFVVDPDTGVLVGSRIGGANSGVSGIIPAASQRRIRINPDRTFLDASANTTVFGIFERADFEILIRALRRNTLLKILAEPNLVAMNGHQASFLAGGEFPIPVPQSAGGGVAGSTITIQFREFGVRLGFVPFILDNDVIRLTVDPEVSSIDFTLGTTLVIGGTPVPGLNTRKAHTTVEMRQGQTLAIAGLLQLTLDGQFGRIPGLGDLPILGPFFSNTTNSRMEKELVVLVTPYLVEPMNCDQVPPSPGDEVKSANDLEFYLLGRIEGRTGIDHRTTTNWDDPLHVLRNFFKVQTDHVRGPYGFSD